MQIARDNANRILRAFPDYGKSPPEYIASLVQVMASYPVNIQDRLTDLRRGIPAKCKFLPTIAEVVEMADEALKADATAANFNERFAGRTVVPNPPRRPFVPFPALLSAFANEPDMLISKTFEAYADAAKALATQGREAARIILGSQSRKDAA